MVSRAKAYKRGIWAERFAALYLICKGYRILKLRYKTPAGEIDIAARRGDALVMVEVKARARLRDALESVQPRGRGRIEKATGHFIAHHPELSRAAVRFDVVAVQTRWPFLVKHLDNAWQART